MPPLLLLLLLLLLSAGHAHMTPPTPLPGNNSQQNVKVVVTTGCVSTDDSTDGGQGGPELSLAPGSPLVLTHRIRLLPLAAGAETCGCEANMAALRERLERLEREVSELRERCGGGGGCCSSKEIKGAGCTISSQVSECPNECSDQGRCEDGVCVCFPGFTGDDCSSILCPENCSSRGRCVEGRCVCDEGFSGEDCSTLVCPENCSSRGRCVEGRCVCDEGYTGDDCAALVCPENCSSRGRCVEGRCVCDDGYTGDGCSERVCPKRCSGRGQCVNGSCVCAAGFTGSDCGAKACPAHCSGKGRCVKGKCVCRRGFAEPDCSRCVDGMTGPDCDAEMSGVSELSTRNITESSVTLFWTPPAVNYDTYHVTFDSQKEGDQQISVPVDGGLTSFTQRGLAAGQEYTVTVTGETEGRRGAEASSQFVTLISGPTNLRVVKTTSTSAVVQWEGSQGEIDRYRLSVSPSDGAGKSQELTFQPDQDSAHITELEAGRLYHVRLVAEKGSSHSEPASTHAVPESTFPAVAVATAATLVTPSPGQEGSVKELESSASPEKRVNDQQGEEKKVVNIGGSLIDSGVGGFSKDPPATVIARTKPLINNKNGSRLNLAKRPVWSKKQHPPTLLRWNGTRVQPGGRNYAPLRTIPSRNVKKVALVAKKLKAGPPVRGNRTIALAGKDPSVTTWTTQRSDDLESDVTSDSRSGERRSPDAPVPTVRAGVQGSSSPASQLPSAHLSGERKCLNKIKVTHIRFPQKDRGSGCAGEGAVLIDRTTSDSSQGSSEMDDMPLKLLQPSSDSEPPSTGVDISHPPDPLQKVLIDTFNSLNVTTFSVHRADLPKIAVEDDSVRKQILSGLEPLLPFSSSPSAQSTGASSSDSSSEESSETPVSLTSSHSPTSLPFISPMTPLSSPFPGSERSDSLKPSQFEIDRRISDTGSPERRNVPPIGVSRRPHPKLVPPQRRTHFDSKNRQRFPFPVNVNPPKKPFRSQEFPPTSSNPPPFEVQTVVGARNEDEDGTGTLTAPGVEQNQKKMPVGKGRLADLNLSPAGRPWRYPLSNRRPLQNRTHPNPRYPIRPFRPMKPKTETNRDRILPTAQPATSPFISRGSYPAVRTWTEVTNPTDSASDRISTEAVPPPPQPTPKTNPHLYVGPFRNRTRTILRPPQPPRQGPVRKPLPTRMQNGGHGTQASKLQAERRPGIPDSPSRMRDGTNLTQQVQPAQAGDRDTPEVIRSVHSGEKSKTAQQVQQSEKEDNLIPTSKSPEDEEVRIPDTDSRMNTEKEQGKGAENPGAMVHKRPLSKQPSHDYRDGASRPVVSPKRQPLSRKTTTFTPQKLGDPRTNHSIALVSKTLANKGDKSKVPNERSGVPNILSPIQEIQTGNQDKAELVQSVHVGDDASTIRPQVNQVRTQVKQVKPNSPYSKYVPDTDEDRVTSGRIPGTPIQRRPNPKQMTSDSRQRPLKPAAFPKRQPHIPRIAAQPPRVGDKKKHIQKLDNGTEETRAAGSKPPTDSTVLSSDITREPLNNVQVIDRTSDGFRVSWDAPEGKYKNFVVTRKEVGKGEERRESQESKREDSEGGKKGERQQSDDKGDEKPEENKLVEHVVTQSPRVRGEAETKPARGSDQTFKKVLPGSTRSFQFEDLHPRTEYFVTLLGKSPGLLSRMHKLVISTGPEPPSNVVFSDVSENSMTVSWVKPKSPVDGFKVTYTSLDDGEPVSVSLERNHSTLELTQLAPGSAYEVNVISILGLDESDPVRETVATHPDPPSDLRAINVTDTDALLLWRPALAAVDEYTIIYSSGNGSGLRVSVSGNVAQHLLGGLEGSTAYSVTISSLQGGVESRTAAASFTTAASGGAADDGPQDLRASHVTPRTATLSWKPASEPAGSYKLTYQTEGQDAKEVVVGAMTTELNLTRLRPGAEYKVQLQKEGGADIISTAFTTAVLRFPFPTDCSQELLNGILLSGVAEIFPSGESGAPLTVYCDMQTDGGGWTVFQRRKDGSEDFFRGWKEYVRGFGDPSGEFWLGLESIHNLTASGRMMLRVDLRDGDDSAFATYDTFQVARRNYRLTVSGYSGTAGDSLSYHNNRIFSTRDRDPGAFITRCAMSYRGGWWYKNCHQANLNGLYGIDVNHQGLIWTTWKGEDISVTFSEMKMRPAAFAPPVHG